jgi:hypothetical protein
MPSRLFAREFNAVCDIGEVVMLLGTSGPYNDASSSSPFFQVTMLEAIPQMGQHGAIIIYAQSGSAPAGYALDQKAATGNINAGQSVSTTPQALVMASRTLFQFRTLVKVGGTLTGVADDLDVACFLPTATQRWAVQNSYGVINPMGQFTLPGDAAALPNQGSNIAYPTVTTQADPFDMAYATELFSYQDQSPQFRISNNGSGNISTAEYVGLVVRGFRYDLAPLTPDTSWEVQNVVGLAMKAPPCDFTILPIGGRAPVM